MKKNLTTRNLTVPVEARSSEGGAKYVSGLIPYDKESEDLGGFTEVIRRGAFDGSLKNGDIRCLWSHNMQYVLGRSAANTLKLEDRQEGLYFECLLPGTAWAEDLYRSIDRKDVPGVSFGFVAKQDRWTHENNKLSLRELLDVELFEISVGVAFPAYPDAEANTRALLENAGLNLDAITSCIRNKENDCITKDDTQAVRAAITSLENLISGNQKSDSADFDVRAREIDLLESEYTIGV